MKQPNAIKQPKPKLTLFPPKPPQPARLVAESPTATSWRKQLPRPVTFYLHGAGLFDFRTEISNYLGRMLGMHEAARPSWWQHSVDAFLVPALYSHPLRSHSPADAAVHVLALAPSACQGVYNTSSLTARMDGIAHALNRTLRSRDAARGDATLLRSHGPRGETSHGVRSDIAVAAAAWANTSVRMLVFAPGETLEAQMGRLLSGMLSGRPNVRIATCDNGFGGIRPNQPYSHLYRQAIPLPYLVRPSFSAFAVEACRSGGGHALLAQKPPSVIFHGDTGRCSGQWRQAMWREVCVLRSDCLIASLVGWVPPHRNAQV